MPLARISRQLSLEIKLLKSHHQFTKISVFCISLESDLYDSLPGKTGNDAIRTAKCKGKSLT